MLRFLSIRDFVIVDCMELEFAPGFTALTGETGAGKSILIDALSLVLGERGDTGEVREGCDRAEISAEFDIGALPEAGEWLRCNGFEGEGDEGDTCLMRRVMDRGGRSRGFINGRPATVQQLRAAGELLVDIHGQHAHQSLLRGDAQRELVDAFSGSGDLSRSTGDAYRRWSAARQRRLDWERNRTASAQEREQLEWQRDELAALHFSLEEWLALQTDHERQTHAGSLLEGAQMALDLLSEGEQAALAQVASVVSRLSGLQERDAALEPILDLLESARIQLQESVYELERYPQRLDFDPQTLQHMEERLSAVHAVARKYRIAPAELADLLAATSAQLAQLGSEGDGTALAQEEAQAHQHYLALAGRLSEARKTAATALGHKVTAAMQDLAMAGGEFAVALVPLEQAGANGMEQVEFQVSAHRGLPLRPLAKVASGGELSRISLAIQVVTSKLGSVPTLVFDEVDAGIGGRVAEMVGGLLKRLGVERQVMCVTHLAQVAAAGDNQWRVAKSVDPGAAVSSHVTVLGEQERVEEIARMLGGERITEITRRHAAEMLRSAQAALTPPS
ncbi:DNA repair protein RecN [Nitrosovibrio sp. Nv17]|uniref:DNA repair protein RecN n=1 Tax=Nitrosovibrio sp. Nv17 TaxID=1855339 RepID=UPI0009089587|nr:DNA repair protein RecN [Nitrosovibrio sp. Nv17]SFW19603.1 DNA replication and repair protein RecN [Nitrosovibrio sp. Nv17]